MFGSLNNNDLRSHNVRKIGPKCTVREGLGGIALLEGSMSQGGAVRLQKPKAVLLSLFACCPCMKM